MKDKQEVDFSGKMMLDIAPEKMGPTDYGDARNIQFLSDNESTTGKHIPMKGSIPAFDLGSVAVQNKTWRLYTKQDAAANGFNLQAIDQNGNVINGGTIASDVYPTLPVSGGGSQTTAVNTWITTFVDPTATVIGTGTTNGYIDITLNGIIGYDINFTMSNSALNPSFPKPDFARLEIRQEAYDVSLTGELRDIESNDLLRDLYMWSTPQTHLPEAQTLSVSAVTNNGGRFQVQFTAAHNLINGHKISISTSNTAIDGIWIITVINITTIKLEEYYANFSAIASPFNVVVTSYLEGVGEIGAAVYDENADVWTYTRLLRSKEWNFRTKKQIDGRPATRTTVRDSFYFTDSFNNPGCFYYTKPFTLDGALSFNGGKYAYGSIAQETKNILSSTNARITFDSQAQSGGRVASGNWRYAVRFLSNTLTATEPSSLTNPVNVFTVGLDFPTPSVNVIGDEPSVITPKINILTVTGITPGLYKYVELLGVNYIGDAISGYVIKRIALDTVSDTLTIDHTGTESDTINMDLALLNKVSAQIKTAKSNEIIDNRLIYSNLTYNQQKDLSAWFLTFKHTLAKKAVTGFFNYYSKPENVNQFVGYTHNEVQRFAGRVRFTDGSFWSSAFFIDDIAFTTYATNLKPDGVSAASQWSDPARRNGSYADFDLTDNLTTLYIPYVTFENIDLDFIVDGSRIRDLIDRIEIVRCDTIKEVLASGVGILAVTGSAYTGESGGGVYIISSEDPAINPPTPAGHIEFPFVSGHSGAALTTNPLYPYDNATYPAEGANFLADRTRMSIYSMDLFFNNESINFAASDRIINHGNPENISFVNGITNTSPAFSNYGAYSGKTGVTNASVQTITPTDFFDVNQGQDVTIAGTIFRKKVPISDTVGAPGYCDNPKGLIVRGTSATNPSAKPDYGLRYVQYYRAVADKYGEPINSKYVTTECGADIDKNTTSPISIDVFGGDTFTQVYYFKHRYGNTINSGLAGGISFYSQTRINAVMRMKTAGSTQDLYPAIANDVWLESQTTVNEDYQSGYTIRNQVQSTIAYNPNVESVSSRPNWFHWSDINLGDSPTDSYRSFPPGNFHVLNGSYGAIQNHANANGELVSWQDRAFMRQYFNTRGTLQVKGITEILIGDGSVMSRDGVTMSRFGSLHKWSVVKGVTRNGDDVYMWINSELKNVSHYSSNGTLTVSDEGVKSFFANNLTWINGKDSPADLEGIHGVYDQRYNNFIFTVRGKNTSIDEWDPLTFYGAAGIKVYYSSDPFNIIGDVYESILTSTGSQPDLFPLLWKKLPNTNGAYFNQYTMVFNGYKNGFICSAAFAPKIYNKWQNTFLSPRYVSPEYKLYLHNKGTELTWYDYLGVSLQEKAYITGIINKHPELTKWPTAIGIDCDLQPDSMDFETKLHKSFLTTGEFEYFEDSWYSPVKEDSTTSGVNDGNTSLLWGKYLKAKFNFAVGVSQRLSNFIVTFEISRILK